MDNVRNGYSYRCRGGLQIALQEEDQYEEADVRAVLDDRGGRAPPAFYYEDDPHPKPEGFVINKGIPRWDPGPGTLRSAPVNISELNAEGMESSSGKGKEKETREYNSDDEKGEREEEEEEWETGVPPHEVIARRSHISSFSVLEGFGRKLKGRELAKVRRAVLTRTGFLESPSAHHDII